MVSRQFHGLKVVAKIRVTNSLITSNFHYLYKLPCKWYVPNEWFRHIIGTGASIKIEELSSKYAIHFIIVQTIRETTLCRYVRTSLCSGRPTSQRLRRTSPKCPVPKRPHHLRLYWQFSKRQYARVSGHKKTFLSQTRPGPSPAKRPLGKMRIGCNVTVGDAVYVGALQNCFLSTLWACVSFGLNRSLGEFCEVVVG